MMTTVTQKNMITIPAVISRKFSISPGYRMDWQAVEGSDDQIIVRVIPKKGGLARRLQGAGRVHSPERDAVSELVQEREREDQP